MSKATAENPGNNPTRDWQDRDHRHYLHPFTDHKDLGNKGTRIITHAEGVYITDSEGQKILDGMAGLWCVNLGYGRQELIDAATRQMQQLPYYNCFFSMVWLAYGVSTWVMDVRNSLMPQPGNCSNYRITTAFSRRPILQRSSFPPRFAKSAHLSLTMPFLPAPVQRQTIP